MNLTKLCHKKQVSSVDVSRVWLKRWWPVSFYFPTSIEKSFLVFKWPEGAFEIKVARTQNEQAETVFGVVVDSRSGDKTLATFKTAAEAEAAVQEIYKKCTKKWVRGALKCVLSVLAVWVVFLLFIATFKVFMPADGQTGPVESQAKAESEQMQQQNQASNTPLPEATMPGPKQQGIPGGDIQAVVQESLNDIQGKFNQRQAEIVREATSAAQTNAAKLAQQPQASPASGNVNDILAASKK
jgi:hypothetical protein